MPVIKNVQWFRLALQWRHNERDGVSNHQPHDCLLNRLFRCSSKNTPKLSVTGLCAGNSPVTGEFPTQRDRNAKKKSIWWRHHENPEYYRTKETKPSIAWKPRVTHPDLGMMASYNRNVFRVTGPLWRESICHRRILLRKAYKHRLWCFL